MRMIRAVCAVMVLVLVSLSLGCEAKAQAATKQTVSCSMVQVDHDAVGQAPALKIETRAITVQPASNEKLPNQTIGRPAPETVARE